MKPILIITAVLIYFMGLFAIWAIVYVGAGGKTPVFKRETNNEDHN